MWYTNIKRPLKETALEVKKEEIIIFGYTCNEFSDCM